MIRVGERLVGFVRSNNRVPLFDVRRLEISNKLFEQTVKFDERRGGGTLAIVENNT